MYSAIEEADFLAIDGEFSGKSRRVWNGLEAPDAVVLEQVPKHRCLQNQILAAGFQKRSAVVTAV